MARGHGAVAPSLAFRQTCKVLMMLTIFVPGPICPYIIIFWKIHYSLSRISLDPVTDRSSQALAPLTPLVKPGYCPRPNNGHPEGLHSDRSSERAQRSSSPSRNYLAVNHIATKIC